MLYVFWNLKLLDYVFFNVFWSAISKKKRKIRILECTWPQTVWRSPTKVVSCTLLTRGRVLSYRYSASLESAILLPQAWSCGTTFQLIWDKLTFITNSLSSYLRLFCSHVRSRHIVTSLSKCPYLLTFLTCFQGDHMQVNNSDEEDEEEDELHYEMEFGDHR